MITNKTSDSLKQLARAGASLEVDAARFPSATLAQVAALLQPGAFLKVCNSDRYATDGLHNIVSAKPGQVILA
ncbi:MULTISPECIES: hypothetical protein [unclassified Rhizobium]|uniref:hypothetical protein n=1 Tax=unclassified Rhizobium TaxID=2613769 RepID=UPI000BCC4CD5|nr:MULTISPECIES: hypothetical protein [unclassified Rhizobium]MDH7805720.1 hypothetical protein [Rhizobium sp. AN67]MDQ4407194.1 hypothetical protein [Rhizobium sp. AN63]SOD59789.1 hypothetical protein SAMN05216595_4954 [Rhizobium sp. AN6A]